MQGHIRQTDEKFDEIYKEGKLLPADKPAGVLAALAARGLRIEPQSGEPLGTGKFVSWDDPLLKDYHEVTSS